MNDELVHCAVSDGVAVLTLTNPPMNVVSMALTRELAQLLGQLRTDRSVRALIITGAGERAFCAGSDVREFPALIEGGNFVERKLAFENETFSLIETFPKPTIAALNGLAFGGGLEMAVCCDLIVAEQQASLALPEIRLGAIPGSGGTIRVTRRIGEGRAREMMLLGEPIDATTAHHWGLVNRVVASGRALLEASILAKSLAKGPKEALASCKRSIGDAFDLPKQQALARVLELSDHIFRTDDCREGVRAFLEKDANPSFSDN
ncbi:enoyl-CoA hydratase/isomerase family protein [Salinicola halimionae]|uniref:enoyl-CoA hydratase/isomerase family protein n=1 Tax=Salinicola halimionae TaxID=1949081 RepID=UPI000DA2431B|nr:enoyl-CoA hydratase-related protein [Salinicola halimionae]